MIKKLSVHSKNDARRKKVNELVDAVNVMWDSLVDVALGNPTWFSDLKGIDERVKEVKNPICSCPKELGEITMGYTSWRCTVHGHRSITLAKE